VSDDADPDEDHSAEGGLQNINEVLAENLARIMADRGMTQQTLANLSGVGQTTISLYLRPGDRLQGARARPPSAKLSEVEAIAQALGVQIWDLLVRLTPAERDMLRGAWAMISEQRAAAAKRGGQRLVGAENILSSLNRHVDEQRQRARKSTDEEPKGKTPAEPAPTPSPPRKR
jgi:transcriptional regulator with XRE-family HTH domain